MHARLLMLTTIVLPFLSVSVQAQFDPQKAFEAHRDLMVGGTWVSSDANGVQEADRHIASKSKKFVRIVNVFGGTAFAAIYGIDPESGALTLWSFEDDEEGSVTKWKCTAHENGKWTWVSDHAGGSASGTAIVTRVNKDEIKLEIKGESPYEKNWKRKR